MILVKQLKKIMTYRHDKTIVIKQKSEILIVFLMLKNL